jgi:GMP synthase (glutamine-hydrolysing)
MPTRPVLILQHMHNDSPAYLAQWLREQGQAFELRNSAAGEMPPSSLHGYTALALLGGDMSANHDLPALRQEEQLFRQALAQQVPTIGHCLGGQLMARALGARIGASPAPEIGWHTAELLPNASTRHWFGPAPRAMVFHWHYEAFELPPGAQRLASSPACPNQAFAIGPHLAMQFHLEVDAQKLARWSQDWDPEYEAARAAHPSVQSGPHIRELTAVHLRPHQSWAAQVYARWLAAAG